MPRQTKFFFPPFYGGDFRIIVEAPKFLDGAPGFRSALAARKWAESNVDLVAGHQLIIVKFYEALRFESEITSKVTVRRRPKFEKAPESLPNEPEDKQVPEDLF